MGLEITVYMCSWGKFWTKKYKEKKPSQLPFLKSLEQKYWVCDPKAGYCICPSALSTTKGLPNHLSHPSSSTPGLTPALTHILRNVLTLPWGMSRESVVCSASC